MNSVIKDAIQIGQDDCIKDLGGLIGELSERDIRLAKYAYAYGMSTANRMQDAIKRVFDHDKPNRL